jgi:hypothetical protein
MLFVDVANNSFKSLFQRVLVVAEALFLKINLIFSAEFVNRVLSDVVHDTSSNDKD